MSKDPKDLRIIFMGTPVFAEKILSSLIETGYSLVSVYTRPDKKTGRNQEIKKSPVKILAEKNKISVFEPLKMDEIAIAGIKKQDPDLIIVAAYGKILQESILDIPKYKSINIHPSLLPKFRGPSPIQNALLAGEKETGTTIMLMDKGMDTGAILSQKKISIGENEIYPELSERLADISSKLLLETIPLWVNGKIKPQKQDDLKATLCQLIEREDGKIIWSDDAEKIYNKYRALSPWPGIFTFWEKGRNFRRIKLNKISFSKEEIKKEIHIGEVFKLNDQVAVKAPGGLVIIEEIQLEGKNASKIKDFINGYPNFIGSVLK